jgi:uncharacterized protein YjbI with pentapeptide repeats
LRGTNLRAANLRGANLRNSDFSSPKQGTDLGLAFIVTTLFATLATGIRGGRNPWEALSGADLRGANLSNADLRDVVLRGALVDGADLTNANLSGADLRDATLGSIKWIGQPTFTTRLHDADLSGANLRDAKVTSEQLNAFKCLKGATMPNGQKYEDWLKGQKSRREYLIPRDRAYLTVLEEREGREKDR